MEQHRQQYLGEKIALIRNIREENKVRAQGGCNRVIQISVRIFLPIRLCVLSKRIYSSRVQLGVPCNILNTLIDISRSVVARSSFLELYISICFPSLLFALFLLQPTLSLSASSIIHDRSTFSSMLADIRLFLRLFRLSSITSIVKLIRILGINYKSFLLFRQTLIQIPRSRKLSRTSSRSNIDTESKHRSRRSEKTVSNSLEGKIRAIYVASTWPGTRRLSRKEGESGCARANARSLMNRIVGDRSVDDANIQSDMCSTAIERRLFAVESNLHELAYVHVLPPRNRRSKMEAHICT